MKFIKKPDDGLSGPGSGISRLVWHTEDRSCMILLRQIMRHYEPLSDVLVAVYIEDETPVTLTCAKDGVAAFIIKEIINLAERTDYRIFQVPEVPQSFRAGLKRMFDWFGPEASLPAFHKYKESQ